MDDDDDDRPADPPLRRTPSNPLIVPGEEAGDYALSKLTVVPVRPKTKRPYIRWKAFQAEPPTLQQVEQWWQRWPQAGVGLVLGPVSGVLAVDVDGPEAHAELLRRLGGEPPAPKMWSGSGKPQRYQLFFTHPKGVTTKAKFTPWHPQLEFRGQGGLSVLPPSLHPSGQRYRWATGRSFANMDLPPLPPLILAALQNTRPAPAGFATPVAPVELAGVQRRALALITSQVRAVAGNGGDKATFTAACYLVRDFAMSVEQALPVLVAWNRTNCSPPWAEVDLRYKLEKANDWDGERGRLLVRESCVGSEVVAAPLARSTGGETFAMPVADWTLGDWELLQPRWTKAKRGRPSDWRRAVTNVVLAARIAQRSSVVRLPDVVLAQFAWGPRAKWPRRWRSHLRSRLGRLSPKGHVRVLPAKNKGRCGPGCPLHHALDCPHRDVRFRLKNSAQTCLKWFEVGRRKKSITYDFRGNQSHHPDPETAKNWTKQIRAARKAGRLCSVYLPAWVFGPLTLPGGRCRILKSLTRELTRQSGKSTRPDRAEVKTHATDPLVPAGHEYVGFNGNGSRRRPQYHGHGYSLGVRMKRAGAPADPADPTFRSVAKEYLGDLNALSDQFGLVVRARLPDRAEWVPLTTLLGEVDLYRPKLLARKCLIRVYTAGDFLDRWRAWFAAKLGLAGLPRDVTDSPPSPPPTDPTVRTPEQLARWMRDGGWTDSTLAQAVGLSRVQICRYRNGTRRLSDDFRTKLASLLPPTQTGRPGSTN